MNEIGKIYNNWTILAEAIKKKKEGRKYLCRCACGNERVRSLREVKSGRSKSCGCTKRVDLVGKKFNRLTVIEELLPLKKRARYWKCLCECGNETILTTALIFRGTVSCGCYNREVCSLRRGPLHHNWNQNITDEQRMKKGYDPDCGIWAKAVKKKYNNTCQKCFKIGTLNNPNNSHHIYPYKFRPDLKHDIDNGICLCKQCHDKYHNIFGITKDCNITTLNLFLIKDTVDIEPISFIDMYSNYYYM